MYKKVKKQVAGANTCCAMEPETIQKNGENTESHAGRNFLFGYLLLLLALCVGFSSCSIDDDKEGDEAVLEKLIVGEWTNTGRLPAGIIFNSDHTFQELLEYDIINGTTEYSDKIKWKFISKNFLDDGYIIYIDAWQKEDDMGWKNERYGKEYRIRFTNDEAMYMGGTSLYDTSDKYLKIK